MYANVLLTDDENVDSDRIREAEIAERQWFVEKGLNAAIIRKSGEQRLSSQNDRRRETVDHRGQLLRSTQWSAEVVSTTPGG